MRVNKGQWEYRDGQTDQTPDSPILDSWNVNFMSTLILSFHIEHNFLHINFSLLSLPSTGMVPLFQHQKKNKFAANKVLRARPGVCFCAGLVEYLVLYIAVIS